MNQNEDLARKWLRRAESSLAKAKVGSLNDAIMLEDLCFDAQQSSEKALKSLLALNNLTIPKSHSIGFLIKSLEDNGLKIPDEIKESAILTEYAVETRYPGDYEPVGQDEFEKALELAELVLGYVKKMFPVTGIFDVKP